MCGNSGLASSLLKTCDALKENKLSVKEREEYYVKLVSVSLRKCHQQLHFFLR